MWFLTMLAAPADACSRTMLPTHSDWLSIAADTSDVVAPAPPEVEGVDVVRGEPGGSASCRDYGSIRITVARPEGDPDGEDAVGYRLEQVDGDMPPDFVLYDAALLGPELVVYWPEVDPHPFAATLALIPVDAAGNEGAPVEVAVRDRWPVGCATAPGAGSAGWLGLALAFRRRQGQARAASAWATLLLACGGQPWRQFSPGSFTS